MADHDKTTPAPAQTRSEPTTTSQRAEIDAFIQRARTLAPPTEAGQRGRLIFALDATMSRQPTWDTACTLQAEMFREAGSIGGLDVQLVYFRGLNECRASRWVSDGAGLGGLMARIPCQGRPHADRQGAEPRARRERQRQGGRPGLCRRRDGGSDRSISRPLPASSACAACRRSCSTRATIPSPNRRSARSPG